MIYKPTISNNATAQAITICNCIWHIWNLTPVTCHMYLYDMLMFNQLKHLTIGQPFDQKSNLINITCKPV